MLHEIMSQRPSQPRPTPSARKAKATGISKKIAFGAAWCKWCMAEEYLPANHFVSFEPQMKGVESLNRPKPTHGLSREYMKSERHSDGNLRPRLHEATLETRGI
jgi:hypothetical protein